MQMPISEKVRDVLENPRTTALPYVYTLSVATLAAGASTDATRTIDTDSIFILQKLAYAADVGGAAQTDSSRVVPLVSLQLRDGGSDRPFSDTPVPLSAYAGEQGIPYLLPTPYAFDGKSSIFALFENYSAGTTYANITIALHGVRVFGYS